MTKRLLAISFLAFFSFETLAQQFGRIDNFWNIYARANPAQTNSLDSLEANLIGRTQWIGINGAPNTFYANYNQICRKIHGSFGLSSEYDEIGINKSLNFKLNYTFRLSTRIGDWTLGSNIGLNRLGVKSNWIPPQNIEDPSLPNFIQNSLFLDLGIAYKLKNLRLGFSVLQLSSLLKKPSPYYFDYVPHYNFDAAYRLKFNERWSSDIYFQSLAVIGHFTTNLAYVVNYKKQFEFGAIFNNFFYVDSWIFGLSLGYNHKSGIGIYTSGSISNLKSPFFPNPTYEVGLKYRRN